LAFHVLKPTFTRGEISPLAHHRVDLELYLQSAEAVRNWTVMKYGGVRRRPGTRFLGEVKKSWKKTRLIPFVFNVTNQAYQLEFGDGYLRIWRDRGLVLSGGAPFEIASPYLENDLDKIQIAPLNDVVYIACAGYAPRKLSRFADNNWTITLVSFFDGPYLPLNDADNHFWPDSIVEKDTTTLYFDNTSGINGGVGFRASDIGRHFRWQHGGVWSWGRIANIVTPKTIEVFVEESGWVPVADGSLIGHSDNKAPDEQNAGLVSRLHFDPKPRNGTGFRGTDLGRMVRCAQYISGKITEVLNDESVYAEYMTLQPNRLTQTFQLGAFYEGNWPSTVTFFQSRLIWGSTPENPRAIFASKTYFPDRYSPTDVDGNQDERHGFMFDIIAGKADPILWLQDAPRLQLGTASAVRSLGATEAKAAMSPRDVSQELEAHYGAAPVQPVQTGPSTVFVGRTGRALHDMVKDFTTDALAAPDISVLSEHLLKRRVKDMAYQAVPDSFLWFIDHSGNLFGLTLERYEKVQGFHAHDVGGEVESISVIPVEDRDELWMVVKRTINGQTKRYVEVLETPFDSELHSFDDQFYVDCGLTYQGQPANTLGNLGHLEGETVDVLANGIVYQGLVVTNGQVRLPDGATTTYAHVGLPIVDRVVTLEAPPQGPDGSLIGRKKRAVDVLAGVLDTAFLKIGSRGSELRPLRFPPLEGSASLYPKTVYSGAFRVKTDPTWEAGGRIEFSVNKPLAATVLALNIQIESEP
jgi:hypothetical protein